LINGGKNHHHCVDTENTNKSSLSSQIIDPFHKTAQEMNNIEIIRNPFRKEFPIKDNKNSKESLTKNINILMLLDISLPHETTLENYCW